MKNKSQISPISVLTIRKIFNIYFFPKFMSNNTVHNSMPLENNNNYNWMKMNRFTT